MGINGHDVCQTCAGQYVHERAAPAGDAQGLGVVKMKAGCEKLGRGCVMSSG